MSWSRRQFLSLMGVSAASTLAMSPLEALYARKASGKSVFSGGYGELIPDPNGLLDLPKGFQYRAFSRTGEIMSDGTPVPGGHDGMAAFPGANNTVILVRNHELSPNSPTTVVTAEGDKYDPLCKGGTTTLVVGPNRELVKHYVSLSGTYRNCAGGPTPWGSWISCEENTSTLATNRPGSPTNVSKSHGYNFEVPSSATTPVTPEPLIAMGRFNHEAVAVDPRTGIVYETEDQGDSLLYRFIPNQPGNLKAGGTLQALVIKGMPQKKTFAGFPVRQPMPVEWVTIPNPNPNTDSGSGSVRGQGFALGAAQFARGEGISYKDGELYFCCTSGGRVDATGRPNGFGQVWRYVPGADSSIGGTIELFVEATSADELDGPDNIVVAPHGDLIICEDGDDEQFLVGVTPNGELYHFARNAINDQEFAGSCFSPNGNTLFVNIQTPGITFAIWGPWKSQRRA